MVDGRTLLAEYINHRSEDAFRELVNRYVDLVYMAALRSLGTDAHLAEDVTQMVFADLVGAAPCLSEEVRLGGWLHRRTWFVARNVQRRERRRAARERYVTETSAQPDYSRENLEQITPVLDEAINQLCDADRDAILLRFFEKLEFRGVGESLGTTEEAARKRVNRALEKLQTALKRRGVVLSAAGLGTILAEQAVLSAPASLSFTVSSSVLSGVAKGAGSWFAKSLIGTKGLVVGTLAVSGLVVSFAALENSPLATARSGPTTFSTIPKRTDRLGTPNLQAVAAFVNGEPIFESEVRRGFQGYKSVISRQYAKQPALLEPKLEDQWTNCVNVLVDRKLAVMDFERRGQKIPQRELDLAITQAGADTNDIERIKGMIIVGKVRQEVMAQVPNPTPEEVEDYYRNHKPEFRQELRVQVVIASVKKPAMADEQAALENVRKEAIEFRGRLARGAVPDLTDLTDESGPAGMTIRENWYDMSALRPEISRALSSLKPQQTTDLIETSSEIFVVRLLERTPPHELSFPEVQDNISAQLLRTARVAAEKRWYDDLRRKAVIKVFPPPVEL